MIMACGATYTRHEDSSSKTYCLPDPLSSEQDGLGPGRRRVGDEIFFNPNWTVARPLKDDVNRRYLRHAIKIAEEKLNREEVRVLTYFFWVR